MAGLAHLVHTLLEQVEALPEAAEGCGGGSFQEQQVLVQGSEGTRPWQRLNGVYKVLLLSFHLVHHLQNRKRRHGGESEQSTSQQAWGRGAALQPEDCTTQGSGERKRELSPDPRPQATGESAQRVQDTAVL